MAEQMTAAEEAYAAATKAIAKARKTNAFEVTLNGNAYQALDRIPPELRLLLGLTGLNLNNTAISDLAPLQGMTGLKRLYLDQTSITNLAPLQSVTGLKTLSLNKSAITDLAPLQGMTGLQTLSLNQTAITDLAPLQGMAGLQTLSLNQTAITDLAPLQGMTGLHFLSLDQTSITDLAPLQGMTGLQTLSLNQTSITDLAPLQGLTGLHFLSLDQTAISDLSSLSDLTKLRNLFCAKTTISDLSPLRPLTNLIMLRLDETRVSDLSELEDMTQLLDLSFNQTKVSDISPLKRHTSLLSLSLNRTKVRDLRPVLQMPNLGSETYTELSFFGTPAAETSPRLQKLAYSGYHRQRTRETIAYLKTLPPWPEPLPWDVVDERDDLPLTIEAILTAQSPLGFRFSPAEGAMVLYVEKAPTNSLQSQLANMANLRAQELLTKLTGANHGLRHDVAMESRRFADILADNARSLSERSLELWGSLVALGSLLDGNDSGRLNGRDPLDLLAVEQRAALMTLLQIAGNLVRSFPDVKALDDSAGGFLRREVTLEMVAAMIEAALRTAFLAQGSAALMQHVAGIAKGAGGQSDKATGVSVRGVINLITSATKVAGRGTGKLLGLAALGAVTAAGGVVGKGAAEHYELDEVAIAYIESVRDQITLFIENLPPDEAAQLKATLEDMESRLASPKTGPQ